MWKKIGTVFSAAGQYDWMFSHASYPVAIGIDKDIYRIYFSTRDVEKRSSVGYLDIDIKEPLKVISLSSKAVLKAGPQSSFFEKGVSMGSILNCADGQTRLYFLGWNIPDDAPFRNQIGMALKKEQEEEFAPRPAPVLSLNSCDPLTLSYPWVIQDGDLFKMWYGSHESWAKDGFEMLHVLKYAESDDGINWRRSDGQLLPLKKDAGEFAMSRPCVIKENGHYRMWFSSRSPKYEIGYAESEDGKRWIRMNGKHILTTSKSGFDSQTVEYASVFRHNDDLFILYNGNDYGRTGFGIAVWE